MSASISRMDERARATTSACGDIGAVVEYAEYVEYVEYVRTRPKSRRCRVDESAAAQAPLAAYGDFTRLDRAEHVQCLVTVDGVQRVRALRVLRRRVDGGVDGDGRVAPPRASPRGEVFAAFASARPSAASWSTRRCATTSSRIARMASICFRGSPFAASTTRRAGECVAKRRGLAGGPPGDAPPDWRRFAPPRSAARLRRGKAGCAERRAALRRVQHARRGAAQLLDVSTRRRRLPRGGGGRPTGGAAIRLGELFARRFAKGGARELAVEPGGAARIRLAPALPPRGRALPPRAPAPRGPPADRPRGRGRCRARPRTPRLREPHAAHDGVDANRRRRRRAAARASLQERLAPRREQRALARLAFALAPPVLRRGRAHAHDHVRESSGRRAWPSPPAARDCHSGARAWRRARVCSSRRRARSRKSSAARAPAPPRAAPRGAWRACSRSAARARGRASRTSSEAPSRARARDAANRVAASRSAARWDRDARAKRAPGAVVPGGPPRVLRALGTRARPARAAAAAAARPAARARRAFRAAAPKPRNDAVSQPSTRAPPLGAGRPPGWMRVGASRAAFPPRAPLAARATPAPARALPEELAAATAARLARGGRRAASRARAACGRERVSARAAESLPPPSTLPFRRSPCGSTPRRGSQADAAARLARRRAAPRERGCGRRHAPRARPVSSERRRRHRRVLRPRRRRRAAATPPGTRPRARGVRRRPPRAPPSRRGPSPTPPSPSAAGGRTGSRRGRRRGHRLGAFLAPPARRRGPTIGGRRRRRVGESPPRSATVVASRVAARRRRPERRQGPSATAPCACRSPRARGRVRVDARARGARPADAGPRTRRRKLGRTRRAIVRDARPAGRDVGVAELRRARATCGLRPARGPELGVGGSAALARRRDVAGAPPRLPARGTRARARARRGWGRLPRAASARQAAARRVRRTRCRLRATVAVAGEGAARPAATRIDGAAFARRSCRSLPRSAARRCAPCDRARTRAPPVGRPPASPSRARAMAGFQGRGLPGGSTARSPETDAGRSCHSSAHVASSAAPQPPLSRSRPRTSTPPPTAAARVAATRRAAPQRPHDIGGPEA